MKKLEIRTVSQSDADFINQHWAETTDDDLIRLGELKRPDPEENSKFISWFCSTPIDQKTAVEDIRMWCVDGSTLGYSTLKDIQYGVSGQIHLHLSRAFWRKGLGSVLFCLSAREFLTAYKLNKLFCQPKADNAMPNGMLRKLGFAMTATVDFHRSDGAIITQNKYDIDQFTIDQFLDHAQQRFNFSRTSLPEQRSR